MKPQKQRWLPPADGPSGGGDRLQIFKPGPPVYHVPLTGTPTPVIPIPTDEWQIFPNPLFIPGDEWEAWKRHRPKGVKVSDPVLTNGTLPTEEEIAARFRARSQNEQPNRELTVEIDVPDEATDADVKRYVELFVRKADDLYRAGGGNGLKVSGLDVTGDPVPQTDPTPGVAPTVGGAG